MRISLYLGLALLLCVLSPTAAWTQSALDQYERGLLAERSGDVMKAKEFYTRAINMEAGNGAFYLSRANLILKNQDDTSLFNPTNKFNNYLKCLEDYNKAVLLLPESFESHFGRAKVNYIIGNFSVAKLDYNNAVKLSHYFEDKVEALIGRGAAQFKIGEIEGALRDLERAEDYDSTNVKVLNELALIHIHMGQHEVAINTLNKVLVRYPNDPIANANIGYAALRSGRFEKAMSIYNRCLKVNGPDALIYSNLGFCKYKLGRLTGALKDLDEAVKLDGNNSFALKNRALVYLDLGKKDLACNDLHEARAKGYSRKHDSEVINLLGEHCLLLNVKPTHQ